MPRHGLDEYGRKTDVHYERGTKPLGKFKPLPGSSTAPDMKNREDSIRAYVAPSDRSDVPTDRKRYESWQSRRKEVHEPPTQIIVGLKKERQPEQEAAEDKKRLECPFPLVFRPCEPADYNFILNAWMRSFRDAQRSMKNEIYFPGQQNLISELAKRRQLVIGCDGDTPEWIAGFICGVPLEDGRLVVDYIYVKQAYRGRGIGRGLLQSLGWLHDQEIVVTHRTRGIESAFVRYNATYNPYFNQIGFSDV